MQRMWLVAAIAVVGVVAWLLFRNQPGTSRAESPRPASDAAPPPGVSPPAENTPAETAALRAALAMGVPTVTQDEAAALRRRLRSDPAARERAEHLLLAPDTPRDLRMALAFVLGTLEGCDAVLLAALARFRGDEELARCLIFALGATRDPPEDDEVFDMADRPWGVSGPAGLGITVWRSIEDAAIRDALAGFLRDERPGAREAAAIALRHSVAMTPVRSEFLATLRAEASDDVATVLGETLAAWAGGAPAGAEQTAVVSTLLARAGDADLDGYRFRMEDDFRRIPLDAGQQATLAEYAQPAHPYEVRSFALAALSATPAAARPLCAQLLAGDADASVRDLAARVLGTLPQEPSTIIALAAAARDDAAWHVRYQAVDALGRHRPDPGAVAAIRAATGDPDERVARRARELDR